MSGLETTIYTSVPVMTPAPPVVPPPPPAPNPTIALRTCQLCWSLVAPGYEQPHFQWHRDEGLHGPDCEEAADLRLQYAGGEPAEIRPCSCGVAEKEKTD